MLIVELWSGCSHHSIPTFPHAALESLPGILYWCIIVDTKFINDGDHLRTAKSRRSPACCSHETLAPAILVSFIEEEAPMPSSD